MLRYGIPSLRPAHLYRVKNLKGRRRARATRKLEEERDAIVEHVVESAPLVQSEAASRDIRIAQLADGLFSRGTDHIDTFTQVFHLPHGNPCVPEVAFVGRSRAGTSSLLRAAFKSPAAVSRGSNMRRRDGINAYSVGRCVNVLETPGFGGHVVPWATVLQHCVLMRNLVRYRPGLKMLYYVMDAHDRHGISFRDIDALQFLSAEVPNFTIVLTKTDKLRETNSIVEELRYRGIEHPVLSTSAFTMGGVDALRFDMVSNCVHALPTDRLTLSNVFELGNRVGPAGPDVSREHFAPTFVDDAESQWVQAPEAQLLVPRTLQAKPSDTADGSSGNISPLRDPSRWPKNILLTPSRRTNVVKCSADPENPYLTQARFVAPRADLNFRRPSLPKSGLWVDKGRYKAEAPEYFNRPHTVPFYPDVINTRLDPSPQAFVGTSTYYERPGGRALGVRLHQAATVSTINTAAPLRDQPAVQQVPALADALHELGAEDALDDRLPVLAVGRRAEPRKMMLK